MVLYRQAERENRFRDANAGDDFAPEEKEAMDQKMKAFARKRKADEASTPDERLMAAKRSAAVPRLASLMWIRDLDGAVKEGCNDVGLAQWIPGDERPYDDPLRPGETDPGCFIGLMDQKQVQWCAANFLTHKLGMAAHFFHGINHRRANDAEKALLDSGYYGTLLLRLFELNIKYGPWNNGQVFQQVQEQGLDMVKSVGPDNALLLRLWPEICNSHNWLTEEETGVEARRQYIASFAASVEVRHRNGST